MAEYENLFIKMGEDELVETIREGLSFTGYDISKAVLVSLHVNFLLLFFDKCKEQNLYTSKEFKFFNCGTVGDRMPQSLGKSDFSIVLKSGGVEDSSEYWQEQCKQLYDSIARNLPDGSIEPLNQEGTQGERADLLTLFSTLVASGITGKVFVDIIIDGMKTWLEYRPTAEIEFKCPDGSTVKVTKLPLTKLSKFFKENPQLSICQGLNKVKNSIE